MTTRRAHGLIGRPGSVRRRGRSTCLVTGRWLGRTWLVPVLAFVVMAGLLPQVPAVAAAPHRPGGPGSSAKSVAVGSVTAKAPGRSETVGAGAPSFDRRTFPAGGAGVVAVSGAATVVGGLPVTADPVTRADRPQRPGRDPAAAVGPSSLRVQVADRAVADAAGVRGVLLGLSRSDRVAAAGPIRLRLDYGQFANAYGASFGSRLRLVALPACALSTPARRDCQRQTPLRSSNSESTTSVSADVTIAGDAAASGGGTPTVLALTSSGSGANGDYTATSLSPAYGWAAGNQGGSFTYRYPLKVPPSLGGPAPTLSLDYDSGVVDGQTVAQNGQASWVGEGWNLEPGYIERSYRPCAQDGNNTGDLCWFAAKTADGSWSPSMTMVFGGRSTRLLRDNSTAVWHAADDSGLKVEQLTGVAGGPGDNGSYNREYWRVTTLDGTQYYFGAFHRYAGDPATTWGELNAQVVGNNPGEPCNSGQGYFYSGCLQGYRWNLDYVVDPRGNSMTYFYQRWGGAYGFNNNQAGQLYDMSSTLDRVEYGTRAGSEGSTTAPMRVVFGTTRRCIGACNQNTTDYPDTPFDQYCAPGTPNCPNLTSQVFWTPYKLSTVTTQVSTGSGYRNVDQWDLGYTFPPSGDWITPSGNDTSPNLWLQTLTHTGYAADGTTSLAEPTMNFDGTPMVNRKNWGNDLGVAPYIHYRLTLVRTGSGRETAISYTGGGAPFTSQDCVRGWDPQPQANPNRCFPAFFKPVDNAPGWDWFHKYVVTAVTERDLTGGTPDETTTYTYSAAASTTGGRDAASSDAALWRHDDAETLDLAHRSWSRWRGYATVTTAHGPAGGRQTVSTALYHRGMDSDGLASTDNSAMVWNARRVALLAPLATPVGTPGTTGMISGRGGRCLDIAGNNTADGTNVQLWDCNAGPAQVWRYNWVDQTIRSPYSGKCLDVSYAGTANGTNVQLWTCNAGPAQRWQRTPDGGLRNPNSGRCLDLSNAGTVNSTNVQIWDCNAGPAQVWQPQPDGTLLNPQANVRCVDIDHAGTANGTTVWTWPCNASVAQFWTLRPDGSLQNPNSGSCLDITGYGTAAGTPLQLWQCTGGGNQTWAPQADGTIKNPASGRCLDVAGSNGINNGVRLVINDCNSALATQQWIAHYPDTEALGGFTRDEQTLDNGQLVASTIHEPTVTQTAFRPTPKPGGQDWTAQMVTETTTRTRTRLTATNSWRWNQTDTRYDSYGLPTDVTDRGDTAVTTDDRCVHTDYTRNTTGTNYLVSYPSQIVTTNCAASPGDGDYVVGSQILYDGATSTTTAPVMGLATRTTALATVSSGAKTWKQAGRSDYDDYGRITSSLDALDRQTTTAYTPASGAPVTVMTITNPTGWTTTTNLDPGKGVPTTITDVNGKTSTAQYDPLGRLVRVWRANRSTTATPDTQYTYTLSNTAANSIQTQKLGPAGQQITSYTLYDGRLRPRQTQTPAPQAVGGRVITDTTYDGRGLAVKSSVFWNNATGPTGTLASFNDTDVVNQHRYSYDTLERRTVDALYSTSTLKWQTTTGYDGDRTTTTPPAGGIATTTITNARGKTTTLRQYLGDTPTGSYQDTTYTYDRLDRQTGMSDPAGNTWTTSYDLRGRAIQTTDPDKGTTTSSYDDAGQLLSTTDARNITLAYSYDNLGRKTSLWKDAVTTGTKLADWTYDTLTDGTTVKGQAAASNRYTGGNTYTALVTGYDDAYRPLGGTVRIPTAETGLTGDWTTTTSYNVDGSPASMTYPAAGGLAAETVTTSYDNTGLPTTFTGLDTYVADTQYTYWGAATQQLLGTAPKQVKLTSTLDEATGRLIQLSTATQADTTSFTEQLTENYSYNPGGQVTAITETNTGNVVSNQCFGYDGLHQLTEAWTTTATTCPTSPSQATVGGPDAYWTSYRYDPLGDRTSDTTHTTGGDTTHTYTYPAAGTPHPHGVTQITTSGAATGTNSYDYDSTGNTSTRNLAGKPGQTLTWDAEGHLATLADTSTTSYVYDAAGNRLIAHDTTGTTLYLGSTEVHRDTAGTLTATRFYATTAVRTSTSGLTWLASDNHGTGELAINADTLTTTRRKTDPFGNPRGPTPAWPTTHGYVGGPTDPTGLTHLGVREYDPTTGRFISVDPILTPADPIQMNGYGYADNNPTTDSDPTGLCRYRDGDLCIGGGNREVGRIVNNGSGHDVTSGDYCACWKPKPPPCACDHAEEGVHHTGKNGTHTIALPNGVVIINGYVIPGRINNPASFSNTLDNLVPRYGRSDSTDLLETMRMVAIACEHSRECDMPTYLAVRGQLSSLIDSKGDPDRLKRFLAEAGLPAVTVAVGGPGSSNLQPGNNAAAARGTAVHNGAEWREHLKSLGYSPGKKIAQGAIPDAFNQDDDPVELKPDTRSGIRRGTRQLRRYMEVGGYADGELWVYSFGPDGVTFRLAAVPTPNSPRWQKW
jgi:RHS repeat-associated protein